MSFSLEFSSQVCRISSTSVFMQWRVQRRRRAMCGLVAVQLLRPCTASQALFVSVQLLLRQLEGALSAIVRSCAVSVPRRTWGCSRRTS